MSLSDLSRRRILGGFLAVFAGGALTGCGFKPLHGEGGPASEFHGRVALMEASDPETYAFRERMRRRVGDAGDGADFGLFWRLSFDERPVAITPTADVTRYQVTARAIWTLRRFGDGSETGGEVAASGAYDATAGAFATRSAQKDERRRIAETLAELVANRVLSGRPGA